MPVKPSYMLIFQVKSLNHIACQYLIFYVIGLSLSGEHSKEMKW